MIRWTSACTVGLWLGLWSWPTRAEMPTSAADGAEPDRNAGAPADEAVAPSTPAPTEELAEDAPSEAAEDGAAPSPESEPTEGAAAAGDPSTAAAGDTVEDPAAPDESAAEGETPVVPAALPSRPPAAPEADAPRAWGGLLHDPLPAAPPPEDPSTLATGPWRGRFWLDFGLLASIPVAGGPPAGGSVVSAIGEVAFGWRALPYLAVFTAASAYAHDAAQRTVLAGDGTRVEEVAFGRITAFDLAVVRAVLPRPRRWEPWAQVGAGVGARRGPFAARREAIGLVRAGLGMDVWLAPGFTLSPNVGYRLTILDRTVGHAIRAGADLGLHW